MYDKYDVLLWSIPTILLFGIITDMILQTQRQTPLLIGGSVSLILTYYTIVIIEPEY